jgi:GT2 family glycosyltransferase
LSKIQSELDIEIIVVDNNSADKKAMHEWKNAFPNVEFIFNASNEGFGEANNIGVHLAKSDSILVLNPDTIISVDTIQSGLEKLQLDQIGAVAVRMIDGSGEFLPESKRGFPDVKSSVFKFLGMHNLFPNSQVLNQYYVGKNPNENEIDVLAGACFFIRKDVYENIGGFDRRFFMYGEDIDFSYQLHKHGYKIYYISTTEIIHFKGKSSSKISWKYQTDFYYAMHIYWKKNMATSSAGINNVLIPIAIFLLKIASYLKHVLLALFYPVVDSVAIYGGIVLLSHGWANYIKNDPNFFPTSFYSIILPLYTLTWIFSLFIANFYKKSIELSRLFKGAVIGTMFTLILYFILPSAYKFSRGVLLISILFKLFVPILIRLFAGLFSSVRIRFSETALFQAQFIPKELDMNRFADMLRNYSSYEVVQPDPSSMNVVLQIEKLKNEDIIQIIKDKKFQDVWLYSQTHLYLIQSLGKDFDEHIIAEDTNLKVQDMSNRLLKRCLDIGVSVIVIVISLMRMPFHLSKSKVWMMHAWCVLRNQKTWISIHNAELRQQLGLKEGILVINQADNRLSDMKYLREYSVVKEFSVIIQQMFKL